MVFLGLFFASVQVSTSLQIKVCVWSVTAIPWEHLSAVVRNRPDSVCVLILRWEGDAATSAVTCSLDSTLAWDGKQYKVSHKDTQMNIVSAGLHPVKLLPINCTTCTYTRLYVRQQVQSV